MDRASPVGQRAWGAGAVAACVLVALIAVAAGAGLSGMRLTVFHVTPPTGGIGGGVPQNVITGISLVDSLLDTEITESHTVIFHASSPVRTYWQVGTLSSFNGTQWVPRAGGQRGAHRVGGRTEGRVGLDRAPGARADADVHGAGDDHRLRQPAPARPAGHVFRARHQRSDGDPARGCSRPFR